MPGRKDFFLLRGSLDPSDYIWGRAPEEQSINTEAAIKDAASGPARAAPPRVPDGDDDEPDPVPCRKACRREVQPPPSPRRPRPRRSRRDAAQDAQQAQAEEPKPEAAPEVAPEVAPESPVTETVDRQTIATLPSEIRLKILRGVLVADKPFNVYSGWKKTYKRGKPEVHVSILRANSTLYSDGLRVLYGENTFLYLLRDAPQASLHDVDGLARDDDPEMPDDSSDWAADDDGEYVDGATNLAARRRRNRRGGAARDPDEKLINFEKFMPYFRHIVVEAEHNRFFRDTQEHMASVLSVFAAPHDVDDRAPNLHTVTVKVTPRLANGDFTFVDFFAPDSPIIGSLKAVDFQFMQIEVMTAYLASEQGTAGAARRRLDMRWRRVVGRVEAKPPDFWESDAVMVERCSHYKLHLEEAMGGLQDDVFICCRAYQLDATEAERESFRSRGWVEFASEDADVDPEGEGGGNEDGARGDDLL